MATRKRSKNFMQRAVKRPGAFAAKARRAGMSTAAYARKEAHNPRASARTRKQAVLSRTFAKYRPKGRKRRISAKTRSRRRM